MNFDCCRPYVHVRLLNLFYDNVFLPVQEGGGRGRHISVATLKGINWDRQAI